MILSFWVLVGLGILGLPQTSQKCMGYKDSRSMHDAMIMGTLIIGSSSCACTLPGRSAAPSSPICPQGIWPCPR